MRGVVHQVHPWHHPSVPMDPRNHSPGNKATVGICACYQAPWDLENPRKLLPLSVLLRGVRGQGGGGGVAGGW